MKRDTKPQLISILICTTLNLAEIDIKRDIGANGSLATDIIILNCRYQQTTLAQGTVLKELVIFSYSHFIQENVAQPT